MLCHAEDAMEIALADGWYDPCEDTWDTEEHRQIVAKAQNNCPYTDGLDPYTVELVDGKPVVKKNRFKTHMDRAALDEDFKDCKATLDMGEEKS
jgi:hypothetical protein